MTAAERWREALDGWAIPQPILDAAPQPPWGFDVNRFAQRADSMRSQWTISNARAFEALPDRGTVLDVGCGAGAASLPLARRAGRLIGVDASSALLGAFRERAQKEDLEVTAIEGVWPEVAGKTPFADVVVCHHVAYNVPDLAAFFVALTNHGRRRVVVELTSVHPMSRLNALWLQFHKLVRPSAPTASDAVAVARELGFSPQREDWDDAAFECLTGLASREQLLADTLRRLCLPADQAPEVWTAMRPLVLERDGLFGFPPLPVTTLWWPGFEAR